MEQTSKVTPPEVRFWAKVKKTPGCWLWIGNLNRQGYGRVTLGGKKFLAHRISYEMLREPIPPGLTLDHLCRVRNCVNPDHLEPVTQRENLYRGDGWAGQNHRKTHCPHGHEYDEANTRVHNGKRFCRACARESAKRRFDAAYWREWRRKRKGGSNGHRLRG